MVAGRALVDSLGLGAALSADGKSLSVAGYASLMDRDSALQSEVSRLIDLTKPTFADKSIEPILIIKDVHASHT